MIELVSPSGKRVQTSKRTPKSVLSAWASGAVDIDVSEWVGTKMYVRGILIGTVADWGWMPAN